MAADYLTCPLCGFEFEKNDTLCAHGCPLDTMCSLNRCPSCEYEFPKTPKAVSWLARLFKKPAPAPTDRPERVRSLRQLRQGDRATVLCLGAPSERHNTLAVYGFAPQAEITLLQQHPACVVKVGETELALDPEIAQSILVERVEGEDAESEESR